MFTPDELKQIKEAVWESLDQFSGGKPVPDLTIEDVAPIFTEKELTTRQSILRKLEPSDAEKALCEAEHIYDRITDR